MDKLQDTSSNKRIAKNTIMLYIRMIFLLGVSFYTTRAILQALGVTDLGIYNVVGGVVAMFGFVNGSLSSASARFITYSLGQEDSNDISRTFNTIITVHIIFGLIILLFTETIGLWFVMNKLVVPEERMNAAIWVYQSAVVSSIIVIVTAPFNADIIAHEKMSAFAFISIYEAIAKLVIVYILFNVNADRLIVYAVLLVIVQFSVILLYIYYCKKHFVESNFNLLWDVERIKKIFSYAGWVMTGSFAYICCTQGVNIILNMFFGPAVNAARALATQLQGALNQFTTNFQTAVKPQIIKSYAQGNYDRMHTLVLSSTKFGAFLMLLLVVPVLTVTDFVLSIWLGEIPTHTVSFVRIMLLVGIVSAMKDPTMTAIHATGKIKKTEVIEMICLLSVLPISYFLLKFFHISPETTMIVYLIVELYTQIARVWVVYPSIGLNRFVYFTKVLIPILGVGIVAMGLSMFVKTHAPAGIIGSIFQILISELLTIIAIFFIGLSRYERTYVVSKLNNIIIKHKK